jgi:hypothetical protein
MADLIAHLIHPEGKEIVAYEGRLIYKSAKIPATGKRQIAVVDTRATGALLAEARAAGYVDKPIQGKR